MADKGKFADTLTALKEELTGKIPGDLSPEAALEFLGGGDAAALDESLAKYIVLEEGTDLAEQEGLIEELLGNPTLLKDMVLAEGATTGKYGNAMKIYKDIQEQRTNTEHGVLDRLALAICLVHAEPMLENDSPKWGAQKDDHFVEPVNRYLAFEKAFLDGELDDNFHLLDAWNMRFLVDGDEPDAIAAWARQMMRNFRPEQMFKSDEWRYVSLVRSDVPYGQGRVHEDKEDLQFYQNILMNGGICGRRAWFGRFLLRAFGIPTVARPSPGHAALAHWTKDGWVVNLGPGIGAGTTKTDYWFDSDFNDNAMARTNEEEFVKVMRARWIGDLLGEEKLYGAKHAEKQAKRKEAGLWYGASVAARSAIVAGLPEKGEGECPASPVETQSQRLLSADNKKPKIEYNDDGSIIIPAVTSKPKGEGVREMKAFGGGKQVFLESFEPMGKNVLKGGTWKNKAPGCCSGARMISAGMGKYNNWGFRVALSGPNKPDFCPAGEKIIQLNDKVELAMVYIQPGSFTMGGEREKDMKFFGREVPLHEVEITRGFWIGKYPVRQNEYKAVMGKNPSKSTRNPQAPVDNVGEQECLEFCQSFAEAAGGEIRLPTEAEWEHAARCGTNTKYHWGDDEALLPEYGWFKDNSDAASHPCGELKPNQWGLHDMYGNVCERVSDKYEKDYFAESPKKDPQGPSPGTSCDLNYTIEVPKGGKYTLTAEVVTMNEDQRMVVSVGGDEEIDMVMPFTIGEWGEKTVEIELDEGENEIHMYRDEPPQYGMAVKNFIIKPVG